MRAGENRLIGGLSPLSGYINQVRASEPNVLFVIASDMLQGSIIDSEHRGASTIEIMNYLAPDVVTLGDLVACFPFDEAITRYTLTGAQLRRLFAHIMRPENRDGEGECYQVNRGAKAVYRDATHELEELWVGGAPVKDGATYTMCLTASYHEKNAAEFLGISTEEMRKTGPHKMVGTSMRDVLEEYLRNHQNVDATVEGRLVYL